MGNSGPLLLIAHIYIAAYNLVFVRTDSVRSKHFFSNPVVLLFLLSIGNCESYLYKQ